MEVEFVQISKAHLGGKRVLIEKVRDDLKATGKWAIKEDSTILTLISLEHRVPIESTTIGDSKTYGSSSSTIQSKVEVSGNGNVKRPDSADDTAKDGEK